MIKTKDKAKMTDHTIGVDISKFHLDVFRLEDGAARRFDHSAAGFGSLKKWLNKLPCSSTPFLLNLLATFFLIISPFRGLLSSFEVR